MILCIIGLLLVGHINAFAEDSTNAFDVTKVDRNMLLETTDVSRVVWHSPRQAPFRIQGFPWFEQDHVYRRLPVESDWPIREAVDQLANNTAGGQIHFKTNSEKIYLRATIDRPSNMYHMTATGQSGFDLYVGEPGNQRYLATTRFPHDASKYEVLLASVGKENNGVTREYTINFPLYNGVAKLEIGLTDGAELLPPSPLTDERPIVIYGTSITQGGCASRPGMAYSNVLSRHLNMDVINLGFSGNGRGEPELARLICQIKNKRLVVLDYEANALGRKGYPPSIMDSLEPFIEILRQAEHELPILVVSKIIYAREYDKQALYDALIERRDFQRNVVEKRRTNGDKNIFFIDGCQLLDRSESYEYTVDGIHPTDLGFMMMAKGFEPVIKRILSNKE